MGKRTPLYDMHVSHNAKMVDFGGWDMPINYGSQIQEHHVVRNDAGMFDVSHMTVVDLTGDKVRDYLKYLLANNVDRLKDEGKALYSCMLTEQGTVIDDLIVYYVNNTFYRMVVNSSTREKDLAWLNKQAEKFAVSVNVRDDLTMIAVQGPKAREKAHLALGSQTTEQIKDTNVFYIKFISDELLGDIAVARTGYTGEDGYEIMLSKEQASTFWTKLAENEVVPCGLGARDTLRLEAGMNLYGSDMDESITPLEAALTWTVAWEPADRDFIGRAALEKQREQGVTQKLVGLVLEDKGVLRDHQKVFVNGLEGGEITSGSFSPTVGKAIAFARVSSNIGGSCKVEVRGKQLSAKVVKPPFARNGKACL